MKQSVPTPWIDVRSGIKKTLTIGGIRVKSALKVFEHKDFGAVRMVEHEGDWWFVAKDVCDCVALRAKDSIRYVDDDDKSYASRKRLGLHPGKSMLLINESGLYSLILRSRKPEAKKFKKWVTSEVLPSVRKHGVYMSREKLEEFFYNPDTLFSLVKHLKEETERRQELETEVKVLTPYAEFARTVITSAEDVTVNAFAKILHKNGVSIGETRLFQELRNRGYFCYGGYNSRRVNLPYQRWVEKGLFVVAERSLGGSVSPVTMITGKGQLHLVQEFLGAAKEITGEELTEWRKTS
jgi:prophage antirepressor-like protein